MLADYEHLPYAKINPVLLAEKVGMKQIEGDDIAPNYVYVMESLNLGAEDFAHAEALAEADIVEKVSEDATVKESEENSQA